jgi:hypothetical protein
LRREEKRKKWILMFFTYREEEEEMAPSIVKLGILGFLCGVLPTDKKIGENYYKKNKKTE